MKTIPFSLLLSVLAILGATLLEFKKICYGLILGVRSDRPWRRFWGENFDLDSPDKNY
jgi:hypothetical protein